MAARTGSLFQDQNLNGHTNGAATVSGKADFTGQRKARAGGRKPLADLSNTRKPTNQAGGKNVPDGSLNSGKPSVKNLESSRIAASKASEKSHTGCRKALSDISNSRKLPEIKNKNNSLKSSILTEEPLSPSAIAEEMFLHDHKKCIKSQFEDVDAHHFLKTVGLLNDPDDHLTISFEQLPAISKLKCESPRIKLEEVPEELHEREEEFLSARHWSPVSICKTPSLSSCYTMWEDFSGNVKLIESPELSKK